MSMLERTNPTPRPIAFLIGAAAGFLAMVAWIVSPLPTPFVHHQTMLVLAATIAGAFVGAFAPARRIGYAAVIVAVVALIVLMAPVNIAAFARNDPLPPQPLDAVVVLSSDITGEGALDPAGTQRLLSGVQLVRRTGTQLLVTTRITDTIGNRAVTSDADQRAIISLAIDTSRWRVVGPVTSTRDEALRTAALLGVPRSREIAVVTSPAHSRRACAVFEGVGFHVACEPSTERQYAPSAPGGVAGRVRAFSEYAYERLALIKYRLHGWIR